MGRKYQFAASGSSRWLNIVVDLLTRLRIPPPSNVKFRGTADSRLKNWKYVMRLELVEDFRQVGGGNGGYWEDQGYQWYAGI